MPNRRKEELGSYGFNCRKGVDGGNSAGGDLGDLQQLILEVDGGFFVVAVVVAVDFRGGCWWFCVLAVLVVI